MSLMLLIFWIAVVSLFSVLGAWYVKKADRADALIALYVTLVVFANIAVSKIITFDLGFTTLFAPATVLVFSVTFLITDIVNERFGRREAQRMIMIALAAQLALIALSQMVLMANGAPFFAGQAAFETVLGSVPRIIAASLIAFYVSENLDAILFDRIRALTKGKHLWMRNLLSSVPAMALDSIIFVTLAFYGVMPIVPVMVGLIAIKWIVCVVDIPFMYLARRIMGQKVQEVSFAH